MHQDDSGANGSGLDLGNAFKEKDMDLNLIASAQQLFENQFGFNQQEMDRSILRTERRRAKLSAVLLRGSENIKMIRGYLRWTNKFANARSTG